VQKATALTQYRRTTRPLALPAICCSEHSATHPCRCTCWPGCGLSAQGKDCRYSQAGVTSAAEQGFSVGAFTPSHHHMQQPTKALNQDSGPGLRVVLQYCVQATRGERGQALIFCAPRCGRRVRWPVASSETTGGRTRQEPQSDADHVPAFPLLPPSLFLRLVLLPATSSSVTLCVMLDLCCLFRLGSPVPVRCKQQHKYKVKC
jgi:hypothetical protein